MKIIQLAYSLGPGGAEHLVVDLSNELCKIGHEVIVCTIMDFSISKFYDYGLQYLDKQVKHVNLSQKQGVSIKAVRAVEKFIYQEQPDIVHLHVNLFLVAKIALFNKKIKFIHTLHTIASKASGNILFYPLNYYFYKTNKIIPVTISGECDNSYKNYYRLNNSNCIVNGRAKPSPSPAFQEVKNMIEKLKVSSNTKVFVHLARFATIKNPELLIRAFNEIYKLKYDFILLVLGENYDTEISSNIRKLACERITFFGQQNNVADYLLCSDAFCLTSFYEGLPISLIEAISLGCIPICTPVGGIPDVVKDGITGYLSKSLELEDYVQVLIRFIKSNSIIKEKLIEYYNNNFTIERTAKQYLKLYEQ